MILTNVTRRQFLKGPIGTASGAATWETLSFLGIEPSLASRSHLPAIQLNNLLETYPDRDWERVYQDQYSYDFSFTWVCFLDDTHACQLRAFVKGEVDLRSKQNYVSGNVGDLYDNRATRAWNPRAAVRARPCTAASTAPIPSITRLRASYGRSGATRVSPSFPSDGLTLRNAYKFNSRGTDTSAR